MHEARLRVFRLLVKAGDSSLSVGEIGEHVELARSTLAHHLRAHVDAGIVIQQRRGREVINQVDHQEMTGILDFLTTECCAGVTLKRQDIAV